MVRLRLLLVAGLSAAQWNPNYNLYTAYNAVGYNDGSVPQTDYSGYKGNPDPVPQQYYKPESPRPQFESNNGYDVIFTVAPPIPVAITNPHPSRRVRGSTTPPTARWWETEDTTTTTEIPWWFTSTTERPTTRTNDIPWWVTSTTRRPSATSTTTTTTVKPTTQWWTKKTEKPTPTWSTVAWWVASSTHPAPTTTSRPALTPSHAPTTRPDHTTTTTEATTTTTHSATSSDRSSENEVPIEWWTESALTPATHRNTPSTTRGPLPPSHIVQWWTPSTTRPLKRARGIREWWRREGENQEEIKMTTRRDQTTTTNGFEWRNEETETTTSSDDPIIVTESSTSTHRNTPSTATTRATQSPLIVQEFVTDAPTTTRHSSSSISQEWKTTTIRSTPKLKEILTWNKSRKGRGSTKGCDCQTRTRRTTKSARRTKSTTPSTVHLHKRHSTTPSLPLSTQAGPAQLWTESPTTLSTEITTPSTTTTRAIESPVIVRELITDAPTTTRGPLPPSHIIQWWTPRSTWQPTTTIPVESTEEEEEFYEESTTEMPTTTPDLIVYKTTKVKDVMKREQIDIDVETSTTPMTTTTEEMTTEEETTTVEPTTTLEEEEEEEEEEREPEEMIIESVPVTTIVPLPHPPMLFHSSLEDEFPRPGWVKVEKRPKIVKIDEQKEREGENGDFVDTMFSSSEMSEKEGTQTTTPDGNGESREATHTAWHFLKHEETTPSPVQSAPTQWMTTQKLSRDSTRTASPVDAHGSITPSIHERREEEEENGEDGDVVEGEGLREEMSGEWIVIDTRHKSSPASAESTTSAAAAATTTAAERIETTTRLDEFTPSPSTHSTNPPLNSSTNPPLNSSNRPSALSSTHPSIDNEISESEEESSETITIPTTHGETTHMEWHGSKHEQSTHWSESAVTTTKPTNPITLRQIFTVKRRVRKEGAAEWTMTSPNPAREWSREHKWTEWKHRTDAVQSTTVGSLTTPAAPTTHSPAASAAPQTESLSTTESSTPSSTLRTHHHFETSPSTINPRIVKIHLPFKRHSALPIDHLMHLFTTPFTPSSTLTSTVQASATPQPDTASPTTQYPTTVFVAVTKIRKQKKTRTPLDNFNGNPLMWGVKKTTTERPTTTSAAPTTTAAAATTTTTRAATTSAATAAPTTNAATTTEAATTTTATTSTTTSTTTTSTTQAPTTTSAETRRETVTVPPTTTTITTVAPTSTRRQSTSSPSSTTTTEETVIEMEVNTLPPLTTTELPSTERTHHHSPRAITFAPQTDRPTTTREWTTERTPTTKIEPFPTHSRIDVPEASRFVIHTTTTGPSIPTTIPSTTTFLPSKSSTLPSTTLSPSPPSTSTPISSPSTLISTPSSSPPTLIPSEDFDFEPAATTTEQSSHREQEAELPTTTPGHAPFTQEAELSTTTEDPAPFTPPRAIRPRPPVPVNASELVMEQPDREGPIGDSRMRKKTIKPYAASTTQRTITMKPEKKCCPCCAQKMEADIATSTARSVRSSIGPTVSPSTFAPVPHTNPPQYVVNYYEQQQVPINPPPSYLPQPPPPVYIPPPPPTPICPCAAQLHKPCCELKPCCTPPPPLCPLPCCVPEQQLCCQPNLFEQLTRQFFSALGNMVPPSNNCGVCQGSGMRVARVKRNANGCTQCSGRRKRETAHEEHQRLKRTTGCTARAARSKRTVNRNCANCSSISGIFQRQKRSDDCLPCNARGKREACPCAAAAAAAPTAVAPQLYSSPVSQLSPFQRYKRDVNNKDRGYETLLTCDPSCCDFSRCDEILIFTSRKKTVV